MKILVLNSGSSSIKYQLFNMDNESVLAKGIVERIGIEDSFLEHEVNDEEIVIKEDIPNHSKGISLVIDALLDDNHGVLDSMDDINAVGHRVVHGGEKFADSVRITDEVVEKMEEVSDLAPLHNPPNIAGIKVCQELMPELRRLGYLILLSISPCLQKLILMHFHMSIMRNMVLEDMVFTGLHIDLLLKELQNL